MVTQNITLNPGQSTTVPFQIMAGVPKTYQVAVDGLSGQFTVSPAILEPVQMATGLKRLIWTGYSNSRIGWDDGRFALLEGIANEMPSKFLVGTPSQFTEYTLSPAFTNQTTELFQLTMILSGDTIWTWGGIPPKLSKYQLAGSTATKVWEATVGDSASRPSDLIRLASGNLVACSHQSVSGLPHRYTWILMHPMTLQYSILNVESSATSTHGSHNMAMIQLGNGTIWTSDMGDGYAGCDIFELAESGGGLVQTGFISRYIGKYPSDKNTLFWGWGEMEEYKFWPCEGNCLLAYCNYIGFVYGYPTTGTPDITANVSIVEGGITARTLRYVLAEWVERGGPHTPVVGLTVPDKKVWIAYAPFLRRPSSAPPGEVGQYTVQIGEEVFSWELWLNYETGEKYKLGNLLYDSWFPWDKEKEGYQWHVVGCNNFLAATLADGYIYFWKVGG